MKEREKWKGGKDEEVNRQGGKRGAPAPHGVVLMNGNHGLQRNVGSLGLH